MFLPCPSTSNGKNSLGYNTKDLWISSEEEYFKPLLKELLLEIQLQTDKLPSDPMPLQL